MRRGRRTTCAGVLSSALDLLTRLWIWIGKRRRQRRHDSRVVEGGEPRRRFGADLGVGIAQRAEERVDDGRIANPAPASHRQTPN